LLPIVIVNVVGPSIVATVPPEAAGPGAGALLGAVDVLGTIVLQFFLTVDKLIFNGFRLSLLEVMDSVAEVPGSLIL
jgi:hypothetical protein